MEQSIFSDSYSWIETNKAWLFSGLAIFFITVCWKTFTWLLKKMMKNKPEKNGVQKNLTQTIDNSANATIIQNVEGDVKLKQSDGMIDNSGQKAETNGDKDPHKRSLIVLYDLLIDTEGCLKKILIILAILAVIFAAMVSIVTQF